MASQKSTAMPPDWSFYALAALAAIAGSFIAFHRVRVRRDEFAGRVAVLEVRIEPMAGGFITLRAAVQLLLERRQGVYAAGAVAVSLACTDLREFALDGRLTIWGRRKDSSAREPIPKDYWNSATIDEKDLRAEDGTGGRTDPSVYTTGYRTYLDLCVALDALGPFWPEEKRP